MASHVIEIARQEGAEFRSLRLALEDDGPIKMDAQDIGPNVTRISVHAPACSRCGAAMDVNFGP